MKKYRVKLSEEERTKLEKREDRWKPEENKHGNEETCENIVIWTKIGKKG